MSAFFIYDQNGNITSATTNYPNVVPPLQLLVLNDDDNNVQSALANPAHYMVQNGNLVQAATIQLTRSYAPSGSVNLWTVNISISDGLAHPVTLNLLNHSEALTIAAGGTSYQVAVHQSISSFAFDLIVSGAGLITNDIHVGDALTNPPAVQTYKDANGLLHIAPAQRATLLAYYTGQVSPGSVIADIGTALGMVMDMSHTKVPAAFRLLNSLLTWAQQPTYAPIVLSAQDTADIKQITLTDDENNALADISANVLPSILTTLANAAPKPAAGQPQEYDLHYASYSRHIKLSGQAFSDYVADIQSIPNLV